MRFVWVLREGLPAFLLEDCLGRKTEAEGRSTTTCMFGGELVGYASHTAFNLRSERILPPL